MNGKDMLQYTVPVLLNYVHFFGPWVQPTFSTLVALGKIYSTSCQIANCYSPQRRIKRISPWDSHSPNESQTETAMFAIYSHYISEAAEEMASSMPVPLNCCGCLFVCLNLFLFCVCLFCFCVVIVLKFLLGKIW